MTPNNPLPAPGWVVHKDPMGFTVEIPGGWRVTTDTKTGRVEVWGSGRENVVLWPVTLPHAVPNPQTATAVLRSLAATVWPTVAWDAPQGAGPTAVRQFGHTADQQAVAFFTWVSGPRGTGGCFGALAAVPDRYRQTEPVFTHILDSFRPDGAAARPPLAFVRWQDPREYAFTLEVPAGWQISGGMFRAGPMDSRPAVQAVAPDNQARVTLHDSNIPPFMVPSPLMAMGGFNEGMTYSPGYGIQSVLRRYATGAQFAAEYVQTRAAQGCTDLRWEIRERADVAQALNPNPQPFGTIGPYQQMTAGEVPFTCRYNGQPLHGYYFAATRLNTIYDTQDWRVEQLHGYIATPDWAADARAGLERMLATFQVDTNWYRGQVQTAARAAQIIHETGQWIAQRIEEAHRKQDAVWSETTRQFSNLILGRVDVIDPTTGKQFNVEYGSKYYWVSPLGTVVGTDVHTRPGFSFRRMVQLP